MLEKDTARGAIFESWTRVVRTTSRTSQNEPERPLPYPDVPPSRPAQPVLVLDWMLLS